MKRIKYTYYVADFETTVYESQESTEVWASAVVEMYTEDVHIFHSIDETFMYLLSLKGNICVYFHNLKFDGSFWLYFLLKKLQLNQAFIKNSDKVLDISQIPLQELPNNSFNYSINSKGQWYAIYIKMNNRLIVLRDSLKLLPFSVSELSKAFKTKHHKLEMEYKGFRYAGCEIKEEEKEYISSDVLVVKEALEIMFSEGHNKLTIGSCCLSEYKSHFDKDYWTALFPDLSKISLDPNQYGCENADAYIRKSYRGGWCYIVPEKAGKVYRKSDTFKQGVTADVNSLYPSVMHSASGNRYPVGTPTFWQGEMPNKLKTPGNTYYYFIRIKTRFRIKKNYLPCIQIKNSPNYLGTEWLITSDLFNIIDGKYYKNYIDLNGEKQEAKVILTLTQTDYKLIREHYFLYDTEILDGCYFSTDIGIFDGYINKYMKIKMESKGAKRTLAKLFLNNLYGKFATSLDSSFKYAELSKEDDTVHYYEVIEHNKEPVYIPVGSAITSYARNFTIRTAQKNFYGCDKRGFIYADTDSIHCDLLPEELVDVNVHPTNLLCWKLESTWDEAVFVRQKTYIEHVIEEDLNTVEKPYYQIKCAGMPEKCKHLFDLSMLRAKAEENEKSEAHKEWTDFCKDEWEKLTNDEKEFLSKGRTLDDFTIGLTVPSKLLPETIPGGVLLVETTYKMRDIAPIKLKVKELNNEVN